MKSASFFLFTLSIRGNVLEAKESVSGRQSYRRVHSLTVHAVIF